MSSTTINAPGHVPECLCDQCLDLEIHVNALGRQADRELDAEERAASEAAYWNVARDQRVAQSEYDSATRRAEQIATIRERVAQKQDERRHMASALGRRAQAGVRLGNDAIKAEGRAADRLADLSVTDRRLKAEQERLEQRAAAARVIAEPRQYSADSPNSYFRDIAARLTEQGQPRGIEAEERLARYGRELAYEVDRNSPEGRRALRLLRESTRGAERPDVHERMYTEQERELRALTTGGGILATAGSNAAAFVPPVFLLQDWAPFRGLARAFVDQCHPFPLPDYGMQVYVPLMSATTSASQQTEAGAVAEGVPTTALEGAELQTVAGKVQITQQISDRGFTGGGAFDSVIGRQIHQQLDEKIDLYALNQALASSTAVTGQASYKTANLYQDIAKGREVLTDTAGTRLRPTHFFTTSDFYSYATRQVDASTERPIIVPEFAPGMPISNGADDGPQGDKPRPAWSRFTGTVLPGGLLWFLDDLIAPVGTLSRTQLIVSAPDTAITVCEGEPILESFVESLANELRVVVRLRAYCAVLVRHAAGTASISSAAYTTSLL
jgi:hypothetical protein